MALLQDSLIAHYKMNDNLATDVIIDETGNHNGAVKDAGGTATSAFHSVTGKINKAQEFDAVDDHIEIPDHADFSPVLTPFSISAWINMDDSFTFEIVNKGVDYVDAEWRLFLLAYKIYFRCYDNGNSAYISANYNSSLVAYENQWIHVVATYDGGSVVAGLKIYFNGSQVDNNPSTSGTFVAVENLGSDVRMCQYDKIFYANGTVDNMMFFNKELTALDVKLLYNSGAGVESIPIGIYPSKTGQRTSSFPEN